MVYLEIFIAENILINYLIIYLSKKFLRVQTFHLRIFISACIGAVYGYFQLNGEVGLFSLPVFKIIVSVAMCFCAYGITDIKHKLKELFCLYFFTFVFGGAAYAFINVFGGKITEKGIAIESSEFIYFVLSIFTVCLCFEIYIAYRKKQAFLKKLIYTVKISNRNKSIKLMAFLDTGNNITDKEGKGVCVMEKKYAGRLFGSEDLPEGYISFNTVAGSGLMPYFKAECLEICGEKHIRNASIALYSGKLSKDNKYSVLLSPSYFQEDNYEDQHIENII